MRHLLFNLFDKMFNKHTLGNPALAPLEIKFLDEFEFTIDEASFGLNDYIVK